MLLWWQWSSEIPTVILSNTNRQTFFFFCHYIASDKFGCLFTNSTNALCGFYQRSWWKKKYCFVLCPFQEAVCVSIGVAVLVTFWSGRLLPLSSLHWCFLRWGEVCVCQLRPRQAQRVSQHHGEPIISDSGMFHTLSRSEYSCHKTTTSKAVNEVNKYMSISLKLGFFFV